MVERLLIAGATKHRNYISSSLHIPTVVVGKYYLSNIYKEGEDSKLFIIRVREYLRNIGDVVNLQVQIAAEREDPVLLPQHFPTIKSYDWAPMKSVTSPCLGNILVHLIEWVLQAELS